MKPQSLSIPKKNPNLFAIFNRILADDSKVVWSAVEAGCFMPN
jgi:hypothetical protein